MWPVWLSSSAASQPNSFECQSFLLSQGHLTVVEWVGRVIVLCLVAWPYCLVALDSKARCCTYSSSPFHSPHTGNSLSPVTSLIPPPNSLHPVSFSCSFLLSSIFFFYGWLLQASCCLLRMLLSGH